MLYFCLILYCRVSKKGPNSIFEILELLVPKFSSYCPLHDDIDISSIFDTQFHILRAQPPLWSTFGRFCIFMLWRKGLSPEHRPFLGNTSYRSRRKGINPHLGPFFETHSLTLGRFMLWRKGLSPEHRPFLGNTSYRSRRKGPNPTCFEERA